MAGMEYGETSHSDMPAAVHGAGWGPLHLSCRWRRTRPLISVLPRPIGLGMNRTGRRDLLVSAALTLALGAGMAHSSGRGTAELVPHCTALVGSPAAQCRPGPEVLGRYSTRATDVGAVGAAERIDLSGPDSVSPSCPAVRPVAMVARSDAEYLPGDNREPSYVVTVIGEVVNRSGREVVIRSANVRIHLPAGDMQETAVPGLAGGRLEPGASKTWAVASVATGLKEAAVTSLRYRWADPSLSHCPV